MRTTWIVCLVWALAGVSQRAAAQSTSAQAEALFRRGRQLVAQGKLADGCAAFEGSQALEPMVTTLINLADCREKNRQLATAWGLYVDVARQLRARPDRAHRRLGKVATERAARLEPRLSHLAIEASAAPGLTITRGGEKVEPASWNQPLPIDGGTYELVARVPGHPPWSIQITIADEGEARTVVVPAMTPARARKAPAPAAVAARATPPAPIAQTRATLPDPPRTRGRPSRAPALVTLGAGALAVGGSVVLGALARSTWREARAICGGDQQCDDDAQAAGATALAHDARTRAAWATGLGVTGAAVLGVGAWLMIRTPAARRERSVQLAPHAARDALGVVAWGTF